MSFPKTFPVTSHTDFVEPGSTFVAIKGMKTDGHSYITLAIERGATTIVIDQTVELDNESELSLSKKNITLIRVANCRRALAQLSAQALNYPAKKLKIIGITGTKGKTTTAFVIEHILASAGYKTALLSTVYNKILDQQLPTNLTTQHPDYLHVFFNECLKANVDYVVMEVAAQAFNLERVYDINFDGFIFTNFDREHAEFYPTLDEYFHAKCSLLEQSKTTAPIIINADNEWCTKIITKNRSFITVSQFQKTAQWTFDRGTAPQSPITIKNRLQVFNVSSKLIGDFNAYNNVTAFALCHALGINAEIISMALETFQKVPGRLEHYYLPNNALCCIDYAHNPSSYQSILTTLRALTDHLIVVCGAGGDRDKGKRPLMGALAVQCADIVIFTADNPRSEEPLDIIKQMVDGILSIDHHKFIIEVDREQAIKKAYEFSRSGSIIALLGKGPDHYQIIGDKKFYFNEAEIIKNF